MTGTVVPGSDPGDGSVWTFECDEGRFVELRPEQGEPPTDVAILARNHRDEYLVDPTNAQLNYLLTRLEQPGHFLALTMDGSVTLCVGANGDGTYRAEYRDRWGSMRTNADLMVKVRRLTASGRSVGRTGQPVPE